MRKVTHLIFCSFEVGGLPFSMAEILNRHDQDCLYVALTTQHTSAHDSTHYHFGLTAAPWDYSARFRAIAHSDELVVKELRRLNAEYGLSTCLALGSKAHLLACADIPFKYWSYGSDLDQNCFGPLWPAGYPFWKRLAVYAIFLANTRKQTRQSIRQAESVLIAPYQKPALDRVAPGKPLFWLPHFFPVLSHEVTLTFKTNARQTVYEAIGPGRFLFSSTRHVWCGALSKQADNKGNDIILKAFQSYVQRTGDLELRLVLVLKGPDIEATQKLAVDIGLTRQIVWVDQMPRPKLYAFYAAAEVCFGQFGTPVLTGAALEPLAQATPAISSFTTETAVPSYSVAPPIFNSNNPERIGEHLSAILHSPREYARLSFNSWQWSNSSTSEENFVKHFSAEFG
ncbi:MAG: glycosyltransferase [Proteobacteria bacterium]|nr:glycosyltransferase [Pseudomonadota bacterium]